MKKSERLPQEAAVIPLPANALYDPVIPTPSHFLIGRERELVRVHQRLQNRGNASLTALNGLPGVGKTALAVALAHDPDVRAHFTGGILWAGLGPSPNHQRHLRRWGALLGLSQAEVDSFQDDSVSWAVALRQAIGLRRMLIIIDDAWTIDDALAFKVGGQNCSHLISTRFPAIAAEITADGATAIEELSIKDGMALLREFAPHVVENEEQRTHDLVDAVGGLPLALTLMGSYLRLQSASSNWSITEALQHLSDVGERLNLSEPRNFVEQYPGLSSDTPISLRMIIAVSDQQLSPEVSQALYALSTFPAKPNSFSEEAALAVTDGTLTVLDELTDAGLLEINSAGRYALHQTIADYARLQLRDDRAQKALVSYMVMFVERNCKDYELLDCESASILAALDAAAQSFDVELIRIATAFAPFLLARGLYLIAETHLQQAHHAAMRRDETLGLARTLLYLGELAWKRRQSEQAEKYLREGLVYARVAQDCESEILAKLGTLRWKSGNYQEAETFLQEGLSLARRTGDLEGASEILSILGSVAMRRGQYVQSEAFLREGLALASQIGSHERMCPIFINLGLMAAEQDRVTEAEGWYHEALTLARQLGHSEWISLILNNLGDLASERHEYSQAEIYLQEGLELARRVGSPEWTSFLLLNLGAVAYKQENYTVAEDALNESLLLARQIGIALTISHVLYEYGNLYLAMKQAEQAATLFREMQETVPEESQDLYSLAQYGLARVYAMQGMRNEALQLGEASAQRLETIGVRAAREVRIWLKSI